MLNFFTQNTRSTQTNRSTPARSARGAQTSSSARTSNARSSDSVSLSPRAQLATAANRVSSVLSSLGFSTGTARTTPAQRSSSPSPNANASVRASTGRARSTASRALEAMDAASILNPVTAPLVIGRRAATLIGIESGAINPENGSRLGAYEATRGNERGTTGRAAHNSIGGIYMLLGNFGQDRIGTVFNSREARELYNQPLSNGSSRRLAETEHAYWDAQRQQNGSAGGYMGSAFSPAARDMIQQVMGRI